MKEIQGVPNYIHIGNASELKNPKDRRLYRFYEMLPGLLSWSTLILIVILSYLIPVYTAIFIIIFDIYWLIKTIYLSMHMRSSFVRMRKNLKINWLKKAQEAKPKSQDLAGLKWNDLYHLVMLPMATEPYEVVRDSFEGLIKANYPLDKMIVVLATEERVGQKAQDIAKKIKDNFSHKFYKFIITVHPKDIAGEIAGKGSNEAWAGHEVKRVIDDLAIPYEKIITSVFDIDTVVPHDFFGCLTWNYLTAEKPLRSSYQPIPLFINNIWHAPAFARIFAFSTTFWQMMQQARPEQLVTFSSQSIPFKAITEIGFWQGNVVSEDSRIFWQALLRYDGDWRTIPMHYPVYMDSNVASSFWQTAKNQYKQIRRWLWGVENGAYFRYGFRKNKNVPRKKRWFFTLNIGEKDHSSATNAIIIFLLGWLPTVIGRGNFSQTLLSYNLPQITRTIMSLAMIGLVSSALISIMLLPPRPPQYGKFKWVWIVLQWILFPVNFIVFGAIPALEAQTRLMFGKYMGFWVTPKDRGSDTKFKNEILT